MDWGWFFFNVSHVMFSYIYFNLNFRGRKKRLILKFNFIVFMGLKVSSPPPMDGFDVIDGTLNISNISYTNIIIIFNEKIKFYKFRIQLFTKHLYNTA